MKARISPGQGHRTTPLRKLGIGENYTLGLPRNAFTVRKNRTPAPLAVISLTSLTLPGIKICIYSIKIVVNNERSKRVRALIWGTIFPRRKTNGMSMMKLPHHCQLPP